MGEVYAAQDETLNRSVALKILPPEVVRQPDRLRRFVGEARAASALSHPNLVAIHEIGEARIDLAGESAVHFIAMELVRGQTLEDILRSTARPDLRKIVGWLAQVASAVAAVHAAGIVHRDLKPGNIMVGRDGHAKVLDFGLAKLGPAAGERSEVTIEQTAEGIVLGTIHYMSPEQVQGKEVDPRSDIFSFGCILYQAAAGRRPFTGESSVDVMHAILHETPPSLREVNPDVPAELRRMIRRCLAKDPDHRYQSMRDVAIELAEFVEEWDELSRDSSASSGSGRALVRTPLASPATLWIAAGLLLLLLGTWAAWREWFPARTGPRFDFAPVTAMSGLEMSPVLSPDGNFVVYQSKIDGDWDLYLLRIGGRNPILLTAESDADDTQPAFSPDGQTIAFRSERDQGGIFLMGATGESVRRLTTEGFNPAWSPDGRRIVYDTEGPLDPYGRISVSALWVVDVDSKEKTRIYEGDAVAPRWSPDGRRIAFWGMADPRGSNRDIGTIPSQGGEPVWLTRSEALDWSPVWSADGRYIYFASDRGGSMNLWRIAVDPSSGKGRGRPEAVTAPARWVGHLSLSARGDRILFSSVQVHASVERIEFDAPTRTAVGKARPVTGETQLVGEMDVSPAGDRIVYRTYLAPEDLFVVGSDGGGFVRLTNDSYRDRAPRWSADGRSIVFYSNRDGRYEAWRIRPDGSGLQQLTRRAGREPLYPSLSPDGKRLAAYDYERGTFLIDLEGPLPANHLIELPALSKGPDIFLGTHWSGDGSEIRGVRAARTAGSGSFRLVATALVAYSLDTRHYRELLRLPAPLSFPSVEWSPDGKFALLAAGQSILLCDLESGSSRTLIEFPGSVLDSPAMPADSSALYFVRQLFDSDLWMGTAQTSN